MNIGIGRGTAQKRVTGGRWRRIVLGELLAGQSVELRGVVRVSGRIGSGSLLFAGTAAAPRAGYAIGEARTSPWLRAIAGIRSGHVRLGSSDKVAQVVDHM